MKWIIYILILISLYYLCTCVLYFRPAQQYIRIKYHSKYYKGRSIINYMLHVLLYYYTTILLYYRTTILLYYYTTVLLYYCTTQLENSLNIRAGQRQNLVWIIIQLLYGFRVWMAWSKHAGKLRELRKARETRAEGEWFCALFLTRATFPIVWFRSSKHKNHKVIVL